MWEIAWDMWRHRMEVANADTSATLADNNDIINAEVILRYNLYAEMLPPDLARFFQRNVQAICLENLDYKQHWIEFVDQAIRAAKNPLA